MLRLPLPELRVQVVLVVLGGQVVLAVPAVLVALGGQAAPAVLVASVEAPASSTRHRCSNG